MDAKLRVAWVKPVFFVTGVAFEERTIARNTLAQAYAAYRRSAGMFLPRFWRA